jgi:hypothetical protein
LRFATDGGVGQREFARLLRRRGDRPDPAARTRLRARGIVYVRASRVSDRRSVRVARLRAGDGASRRSLMYRLRARRSAREPERVRGRDHGRWTLVDGVDDLEVVDPAQVRRGDPEIGVPQLPLDHQERDTLAGHLDRVGVPELVRREPPTHARLGCRGAELNADPGRRSWPTACRAAQHTEQRPDRHGRADGEPGLEVLPRPAVHADLAPLPAFPRRTSTAPPAGSRSLSLRASASPIRRPARHRMTMIPRRRRPSRSSPALRMTAMISSTVGGSGG